MSHAVVTDRATESRRLAGELHTTRLTRSEIETVTSRVPDLDLDWAYEIQQAGIDLRLAEGERLVGGKLGFTSVAMRRAMGVDSPNYGWLTGSMLISQSPIKFVAETAGGMTVPVECVYAAFLCFVAAAFAKAGVIPFHTWVPDCGEKAPVSVTAFLPASLHQRARGRNRSVSRRHPR